MPKYDFIQVEDSDLDIADIREEAEKQGLSFKMLSTLSDLAETVQQDDADIWVVDGFFPNTEGGRAEKNAGRAVEIIRKTRADAMIIIYSSAPPAFADIGEKIINKYYMDPKALVTEIRRRLRGGN